MSKILSGRSGSWSSKPTDPFTILELQNPLHDDIELREIRRSPDRKAPKLWKGSSGTNHPTNTFTISEPQDQGIGEFYVVQERRATDFEAPKLWKGSSGIWPTFSYN